LIVGIRCDTGVVIAADRAATYAAAGRPTIGQQEITKIRTLADSMLFASTGAVGISQVLGDMIERGWRGNEFKGMATPAQLMDAIGRRIGQTINPYLVNAQALHAMGQDVSQTLCKSMLAIPCRKTPCLFTFDLNGAPEESDELPFVALGSGQTIADPFLAFIRRTLWKPGIKPNLAQGRFAAAWTIKHVRDTNPGGVGGRTQLAVLTQDPTKTVVEILSDAHLEQHDQMISGAEGALREYIEAPPPDATVPEPPEGPK
jgi:20S proteasome alpha/beta subunit